MIERRELPSGRVTYRVLYYGPDRRERSRSFKRRRDAEAYAALKLSELHRGDRMDPRRKKVTLRAMWEEHERHGMGHLRETTKQNYRQGWKNVEPALGSWHLSRIQPADVAEWVSDVATRKGPDMVRLAHQGCFGCLTMHCETGASRSTLRAGPKGRTSARHIAIPGLLLPILEQPTQGRLPGTLVFPSPEGDYLRNGNWKRMARWDQVTRSIGLER